MVGAICLLVGLLITVPISMISLYVAFETIIGTRFEDEAIPEFAPETPPSDTANFNHLSWSLSFILKKQFRKFWFFLSKDTD